MGRIKTTYNISKKEIIIDKAAALIREKGFKAASMRDLAEIVGVEAASLYNHIKNKNELLYEICLNVADLYNQQIALIETEEVSNLEKIEKLLRFHIQCMVINFEKVFVSDREWKHLSEPYLSNFQMQRRNYRKRFAALINDGIYKNEIKKIDATTAVLIMLYAVSGIESWHRSKQKISGIELEENMIAILVAGLKK